MEALRNMIVSFAVVAFVLLGYGYPSHWLRSRRGSVLSVADVARKSVLEKSQRYEALIASLSNEDKARLWDVHVSEKLKADIAALRGKAA